LFEETTRRCMKRLLGDDLVSKGEGRGVHLFRPQSRRFACEPDVVILHPTGQTAAIGDVKYKDVQTRNQLHSDVYQLLAHCEGFGVKKGFLVFPGAQYSHLVLGETPSGTSVDCFCIRASHMHDAPRA
jgi:hypothetical protein